MKITVDACGMTVLTFVKYQPTFVKKKKML